jgi:hypothetical protein
MANPRIEVEISANVADLSQGVNQATQQLDKLGNAANQTTPQINRLKNATSQYNSVGVDFARIIQDAPFGIIGVGNNITQLAGSFQQLKNSSTSTGAALKTAFTSIFSSGNALILGISALTTVFTVLQMKGFFKTEESAKSLKDRLDEYKDTLDDLSRANLEGAGNAQKEIQNLQLLRKQAENTAVSQEKRLEAVDALQKQYPSYLGNISQEEILNGRADVAYKNITQSILAKAKAQASANQIAQNAIQILTLETKLEEQRAKRLQETSSAQAQIDALIQKRQKEGFLTQGEIQLYDQLISRINKANKTLSDDEELLKEKLRLLEQNVKLEGNVTALIEQGATFTNENNKAKKESIKLEDELIAKIEAANKLREDSAKKLQQLAPKLNLGDKGIKDVNVDTSGFTPTDIIPDFDDSRATQFILRLTEFRNQISQVLEGGVENTIGDFAFSIGEALGNGTSVVKAAGAALLGGLAGVLNQLGQLAIGTGIAIGGIKKALQTLNPVAAIAGGVALIALAGFVSSKARSLSGGFGGGGGSSIGTSGVGGGSGSSFAGGATGGIFDQSKEFNLVSVVRGNDIVLVSQRAMDRVNKG